VGRGRGKILVRGRGGGTFKKLRIIDFYRALWNVPCFIVCFDYNPSNKSSLSLVTYFIGLSGYILSVNKLRIGSTLISSKKIKLKSGNSTFVKMIPRNCKISLLALTPLTKSTLIRSPGTYAVITKKTKFNTFFRLPSGFTKKLDNFCNCTVGKIVKIKYKLLRKNLAGFNRLKGYRPKVRGVAMNPIDHPHGGGVGKKSKKKNKMSP